jgi:LysM repeat protein
MVDSRNDNGEDFVINKDDNENEAEDLRREDYYGDHTSVFQKKSVIPYVIGGVGLIVLIIFFIFMISAPGDVADNEQLQAIEARIQQLEGKLATIGVIDQALDRLAKQEQELDLLGNRLDRFETTVKTQIDQIIKELGILHQKTAHTPTPKAQAQQPAAEDKKEIKPSYHQVRPGETLYGISRLYGLTVDQLRSYNNIGPDAAIQPGQKLKLSRNGKQ